MSQEERDVDEHDQIASPNGKDSSSTFTIYLIFNCSLCMPVCVYGLCVYVCVWGGVHVHM